MTIKNQELVLAVRDYLRGGGVSKLLVSIFGVLTIIVTGQLLLQVKHLPSSIAIVSPVLRDPFTILAVTVFVLSRTTFDFMEFRIQHVALRLTNQDRLLKQLEVPQIYRRTFGNDIAARIWRYRLTFIFLFGVAAIRWIST